MLPSLGISRIIVCGRKQPCVLHCNPIALSSSQVFFYPLPETLCGGSSSATGVRMNLLHVQISFHRLYLYRFHDSSINPVTPAVETTIFAVPTTRILGFVLRASMAIDALRVRAVHSVITRCHSGNLSQDASLALRKRVRVRM